MKTASILIAVLMSLSVCAGAVSFTKTLTTAGPGATIISEDGWEPVQFTYLVELMEAVPGGPYWSYPYTASVTGKNISHVLIEASKDTPVLGSFLETEMFDVNWKSNPPKADDVIVQDWTSQQGNDSLPGPMYGIKFNTVSPLPSGSSGTSWIIHFNSYRVPTWGDFYLKDGKDGGIMQTAWNSGFLAADPTVPYWDPNVLDHILVPDSSVVTIPEIPTAVLAPLGFAVVSLVKRRLTK